MGLFFPRRLRRELWRLNHKADIIIDLLDGIYDKENKMSEQLDLLITKVAEAVTVEEGAITLLTELRAELIAAKDDPAKIQELADNLGAETQKLADAIAAV